MSAAAAGSEGSRLRALRWPLCLLVVLGVHGVAVLRLREIKPTEVGVNAPPAVAIDLAPLPAPPTVLPNPPAPVAPAPPPPVAPPPPEPPPVATEPPPPEPAPLPPEPEPVVNDPLPPPPVPPEVALPRRVPPKRPPPLHHPVEKQSSEVTPSTTTPPADAAARPAQAAPPQAAAPPGAAAASWDAAVSAYLARLLRYPALARRRGEQGVALVSFSVDRAGMVHGITLVQGSGHSELDHEALSLVERAQPLPMPPANATGTPVTVPIRFTLR